MAADGVSRVEDDVEVIEAAEILKEALEVADRRRLLRQQPENVGVERDARHEDDAQEAGGRRDAEDERGVRRAKSRTDSTDAPSLWLIYRGAG